MIELHKSRESYQLLKKASDLSSQKRFRSAEIAFSQALEQCPLSPMKAGIAYEFGVLYWGEVGDGIKARQYFQTVVEVYDSLPANMRDKIVVDVFANSCENLMLLSLSYEEYRSWAERLATIQPNNPILFQQKPRVIDAEEQGQPWYKVLMQFAQSQVDANPVRNLGRFGSAAATIQLVLENRRRFRVPRDDWRIVCIRYMAVVTFIMINTERWWGTRIGKIDYNEFIFVAEDVLDLVSGYMNENETDLEAQKLYVPLKQTLQQSQAMIRAGKSGTGPPSSAWSYGLGTAIGIGLGVTVLATTTFPLNVIIGGLFGFLVLSATIRFIVIRYFWKGHLWHRRGTPSNRRIIEVNDATVNWIANGDLANTLAELGIANVKFRLDAIDAEELMVSLIFKPLQPISQPQIRSTGLALRCIVAMTFPNLASRYTNWQVIQYDTIYAVDLGSGISLPFIGIKSGSRIFGPITFSSEHRNEDESWIVQLFGSPPNMEPRSVIELIQLFEELTPLLIDTFEPVRDKNVEFDNLLMPIR